MAVIHEHLSRRRDNSAGDTIAAVSTSQAEKQIVGHGRRPAWETRFSFAGRHDRHASRRRAERVIIGGDDLPAPIGESAGREA
jgi:hypothetical protein